MMARADAFSPVIGAGVSLAVLISARKNTVSKVSAYETPANVANALSNRNFFINPSTY